ncbi:hypothetical protein QLX08_006676 [Tetragonisca angustula]|uniref:Uncharacterized protein n=1 Tax=Tetragonisca angustula TaxID=166442 RepID=A0AAW0ZT62_9HYME
MPFKRLNNSHVTVLAMAAKDRDEKVKRKRKKPAENPRAPKTEEKTHDLDGKAIGRKERTEQGKTEILNASIHSSEDRYETPYAAAE